MEESDAAIVWMSLFEGLSPERCKLKSVISPYDIEDPDFGICERLTMRASACAVRGSVDSIKTRWSKQPSLRSTLKRSSSLQAARFFR